MKYSIAIIGYTSWCGLGFINGVRHYKYTHEKKRPYIYLNLTIYGMLGTFLYANPILLPLTIHKELYRLEIDIRNLENEKNSNYYNEIL